MEIKLKQLVIFLLMVVFFSCKYSENENTNQELVLKTKTIHSGKKLMEVNCYVCHNPNTKHEDRIAPPMIAIKTHYLSDKTTKEEFIADIQEWIKKPSEETSRMPGAIRNYGLMPYAPYPEETIKQIAEYMFENDLEQPEWFQDHFNNKGKGKGMGRGMGQGNGNRKRHGQANNYEKNYESIGLDYALSTKAQLGKNLMGTINKQGITAAVTFCNERAYFLTDSMSVVHSANIKRVSDKPRNQNNNANATELAHIATFKKMVAEQKEVEAIVEEHENLVKFYYPITTNSMCLQCHGKPEEQIKPETLKTLNRLYPNDRAVGYEVNQVRGIWSITFKK